MQQLLIHIWLILFCIQRIYKHPQQYDDKCGNYIITSFDFHLLFVSAQDPFYSLHITISAMTNDRMCTNIC